ncbi:alpha/beta hydrolase [Vallitalea pronyensis]|uniref:Alpha/beta hydrolase n=1 Tax=Vallitalea pronyensis TaxID=1348613 RepID=A0A8J8MNR3_9FIRM|nr:alpha/beta hydrolase [Vallitalea pronyensis]QUI24578.1 alpha/beta hydrolase [Vallitalea pronyensis]
MNNKPNEQIRTMPMNRIIPSGLDVCDYEVLMKAYENGGNFAEICEQLGDQARLKADKAVEEGHLLTARSFYLRATAVYRVGQYTIIPDNEAKIRMYRKLIDSYTEAAKGFDPPIQKVEIPYGDYTMVGWLRLPKDADNNCPLIISIGGADGWREEHHNHTEFYVERGMAVLMIDGPGQGETRLFNKNYMPLDVEKALDAVVEYMYNDDRVGINIGMVGWSFGGYLVARTAAYSKKLKAVAFSGGSYNPKEILIFLPNFTHVFKALTGKNDEDVFKMLDKMNMKDRCENITAPLLIIHGKPDPIFSVEGVQRIHDEASSTDKTIKIWEDGNHCVSNHYLEVLTTISDWFADRLKS